MGTSVIDDENRIRKKGPLQIAWPVSHDIVMIISNRTSISSLLASRLAEKGLGIMIVSPDSEFKCINAGCPSLILIDCLGKCADIAEYLRSSSSIPIVCLTDTSCNKPIQAHEHVNWDEFTATSDPIHALAINIRNKIELNKAEASMNPEPCFVEFFKNDPLNYPAVLPLDPAAFTNTPSKTEKQVTAPLDSEADIRLSTADEAISLLIVSEREKEAVAFSRQISRFNDIVPVKASVVSPEYVPFQLEQHPPDVLLLDCSVPQTLLSERLRMIRGKTATAKIVMLYASSLPDCTDEIVEFSVSGCMSIEAQPQMVLKGIRAVCEGELWLPRNVLAQVFREMLGKQAIPAASIENSLVGTADQVALLTPQEKRVAELVALGLTNKEIARQCTISPETIKKHLQKIFEKLGINRRSQLAILQANEVLLQRKDLGAGKFKAA